MVAAIAIVSSSAHNVAQRAAMSCHRMCSKGAWAPAPVQPSPSSVGTPIAAAAGGVVINTQSHAAYGNMVEIDHGSGLVTRYAHASKVLVKNGDLVKRGQPVAHVGNTGRSTGPHLHFEVLVDGVPQNPARFLQSPNLS